MAKPVSMRESTCRVVGTNPRTNRLEAAGYFRSEADAERWIIDRDPELVGYVRCHLTELYIELPEPTTGEYIKLGLL